MKRSAIFLLSLLTTTVLGRTQTAAPQTPTPSPAPPVYPAFPAVGAQPQVYVYDQKPVAGRPYLISPDQAQSIINRFKDEHKKAGSPRFLIYVNRDLIDENSGMKLTSHKRVVEMTRGGGQRNTAENAPGVAPAEIERVASTNIYRVRDRKETSLTDRQTVRDVERLFGRPLRMAGVHLADQRVANQLIGGKALDSFSVQPGSEEARREREALTSVADIVLEILVSSKEAAVAELSGDRTYTVPDIQATAIRLSDSKILGQATAADLIGQGTSAGRALRNFGVREIAEATALSLMEDILLQ